MLRGKEITAYQTGEDLIKYNFDSDPESHPTKKEELEQESLSSDEIVALQAQKRSPTKRKKNTLRSPIGLPPLWNRLEQPESLIYGDLFRRLVDKVKKTRDQYL